MTWVHTSLLARLLVALRILPFVKKAERALGVNSFIPLRDSSALSHACRANPLLVFCFDLRLPSYEARGQSTPLITGPVPKSILCERRTFRKKAECSIIHIFPWLTKCDSDRVTYAYYCRRRATLKAVSQWKEVGSHKRVALSMPYVGKTGLIAHAEVLAGTSNESPIDVEHWDGGPRREDVPTNGSEGTGRRRAVMLHQR